MSRVWVTRTAPFNRLTALRLKSAGFDPLVEPALCVLPLRLAGPLAVPDALVFTSLNGVRLHRFLPTLAGLPVFAVGDHSARFARLRGYRNVASASGDVQALRRLIGARLDLGADVLHLGAVQTAGNLTTTLQQDGYRARQLCVYDISERSLADLDRIETRLSRIGTILVHSPRAGRHVAAWLRRTSPEWDGFVCGISEAASAPFDVLPNVRAVVAKRPDEPALLNACTWVKAAQL